MIYTAQIPQFNETIRSLSDKNQFDFPKFTYKSCLYFTGFKIIQGKMTENLLTYNFQISHF